MSPYQGFMQDLLEQVAGDAGLSLDDLYVEWESGSAFVDPSIDPPPQRGACIKTEAGWVPLERDGGPGA